MIYWALLILLVPSSLGARTENTIAHVHVAANDRWMVFARDRDEEFYFTLVTYQTPTVIMHLNYTSVGTEMVRSLSIPTEISNPDLIELVFIGGRRNSSERLLFHVKLRRNEQLDAFSLVDLKTESITALSSLGFESTLGMHPRGTHVFVVGNLAGYVYDMKESHGYDWSAWNEPTNSLYPRVVSVTMDNYVFVGVNVLMVDTIFPAVYVAKLDSSGTMTETLKSFTKMQNIEVDSIKAPMSIKLRGSVGQDYFLMILGFPSEDLVVVSVSANTKRVFEKLHESAEKGINFGQEVILGESNTYGVLSTALATSPWSTGRVQVSYV